MTLCYHCGESVPKGVKISATFNQCDQPMCCIGCKAVAEYLITNNYQDFYSYRKDKLPEGPIENSENSWQHLDETLIFSEMTTTTDSSHVFSVHIKVEGMYCSACGWLINKEFSKLRGVKEVRINSISQLVQIVFDRREIALSQLFQQVEKLGYTPFEQTKNSHITDHEKNQYLKKIAVAGFGMMFIMTLAVPLYSNNYSASELGIRKFLLMVSLLVATVVYFYSGLTFVKNAFRDLRNRHLGMDVPVALSISIAYLVSVYISFQNGLQTHVYFDSMAMFIFFLLLGRFLETQVRHKNMNVREALFSLVPVSVIRIKENTETEKPEEAMVPINQVLKGDSIKVTEGQIIACDGTIVAGKGLINEAILTGESMPKEKTVGDVTLAGSVLITGELLIESTASQSDTFLAKLADLMEMAQSKKPKMLQEMDKIAAYFIAIVLLLALSTFVWYWLYDKNMIMTTVLSVLIATCPCALSLATPAALTAASIRFLNMGLLVTNTQSITQLSKIKNWFFDKTGTLTSAQLELVKTHVVNAEQGYLQIAQAMQNDSHHPIASAFSCQQSLQFESKREIRGNGIEANLDKRVWRMARLDWLQKQGVCIENIAVNEENTLVYLSCDTSLVAIFELTTPLREGAMKLVEELKTSSKKTYIMSGDNSTTVAKCAINLSVPEYQGNMLPEEKIDKIQAIQETGEACIMVGDGVNDAPVLSQADVSISLKQGSHLAHSASDIIVLGQSLAPLQAAIHASDKTNRVIKQNFTWAIVYNLSVTPAAMMGLLQPWMAAVGMSLSSLIVVVNSRRLLRA